MSRTHAQDPASYEAGEPYDAYNRTCVPLRTPLGPITLWFLGEGNVFAQSGYIPSEYGGGQAYNNTDDEAFTWQGRGVVGSCNFFPSDTGWSTEPPAGHVNSVRFSGKGGNITDLMTRGITACWAGVIGRYVTDHPHIPVHAEFRAAVQALADHDKAVYEAEQALALMRKARRNARYAVRRAYLSERATTAPEGMDEPRPYALETASGYVAELDNDRDVLREVQARRHRIEFRAARA
jgi:hypothetical protein